MKIQLLLAGIVLISVFSTAQTSSLNRLHDPVILTGEQIRPLSCYLPGQIAGFSYKNGTWTQIPIQVDERALLDIVIPYGTLAFIIGILPSYLNPKVFLYCDTNTYTGADPVPLIDFDDELVFMAMDAGGESDGSFPQGVIDSVCQQVTIIDPMGGIGYVYLFLNDGSLQQNAGINYVSGASNLMATSGFPANLHYTNPENTSVSSTSYLWHFSSEWVSDELRLTTGNNEDFLDRHKYFLTDTNCYRTEETFSEAENAFIIAKSGPVRHIRSCMGANSGPLTQRTQVFYPGRLDILTDLRVHNIPGFNDTFDWTSAASDMTYRNELNTPGVIVDGTPDSLISGEIHWEQLSGAAGTLSIVHRRTTNMSGDEAQYSSFYEDNLVNPKSNCTGDGKSWGECGIKVTFEQGICTDPMNLGCMGSPYLRTFQTSRTVYVDAPFGTADIAMLYDEQVDHPLEFSVDKCELILDVADRGNNETKIYPNPGKGIFSISLAREADLEIYDIVGHLEQTTKLCPDNNIVCLEHPGIFNFILTFPDGLKYTELVVVSK